MKHISMRAIFIIGLIGSLLPVIAWADGCQGQSTTCFDGCSGSNIMIPNADSCNSSFDPSRGCNAAFGYCSSSSESQNCQGQSSTCFDGCSGSNIMIPNANSCGSGFDPSRGCNAAFGYCN
jgi:hypothetical protein